jgi:hypothetical protein
MNHFQKSLDRYLTSEPQDDFSPYFDEVTESMSNSFFEKNEDWIIGYKTSDQCEKWVYKLYRKDYKPKKVAAIIERAHQLYIKNRK